MRSILRPIVLALIVLPAAMPMAEAATWKVAPDQSALRVAFKQGAAGVNGQFQHFGGTIEFDPAALDHSAIVMKIDLASLSTGDAGRDGQAKGAMWLDAANASEAVYKTLSIKHESGDLYAIEAELTLRGVTRHLTHEATIAIDGDRAHATGTVILHRLDYKVGQDADPSGTTVGLDVDVSFDIAATKG
jgi:polyisoprenoid-binding protein YceI